MAIKNALRGAISPAMWTALRRLRLKWMLATFPRRVVQHTYAGFPLRIEIADPLAEGWYDRDWLEPPAIGLLRRHGLREGATVFNIGAHQGVIALMLAKRVGERGRVVAVEAMPFNARAAARNRELNHAPQLTIVHAAAAGRSGRLHFAPSLNGALDPATGTGGKFSVEAVTVDDLADRYGVPDVLYIDVEGLECQVLKGAARTLSSRPDCVLEAHVGCGLERFGGSVDELLGFFPPEAYTTYIMDDERVSEDEDGIRPLDRRHPMLESLFQLGAMGRRP